MDNGLNFKKMRNKLNLKEGEVQRILGLHKKAINENLNIFSTNKPVLSEAVKYSQKDEHPFDRIETATPQKKGEERIKSFWTPEETKWEETKDGAKTTLDDYNGTKVFFKCKKYKNFDFLVDEANNGKYVWFKSEKLGSVLRGKFCKNKSADEGSSDSGKKTYKQEYDQTLKYDTPQEIRGTNGYKMTFTDFKIPAGTIYTSLPEKNGISFKIKSGDKVLFGWFGCKSKKFSVNKIPLTDKKQALTKKLVSELCKVADTKKNINTPDTNSGKNEEGNDGFLAAGTSGTKYSFDFETIMKAIDDTGKCPRTGTSDQVDTSGTSGVQGTQGTSGVGAPVVIQKPTVTKDDFYQWTMD
jgi:hypothetical protein